MAVINLVTNGDFSSGIWTEKWNPTWGNCVLTENGGLVGNSVKMTITVAYQGNRTYGMVSARNIHLTPGSYTLKFRARANKAALNLSYVYLMSNTAGNKNLTPYPVATTTWTNFEMPFTVTTEATNYGFMLALMMGAATAAAKQNDWLEVSDVHLDIEVASAPVINITNISRTTISDEAGANECIVTFESDQALTYWEVRADGNGTHGSGLLVEQGTTLAANTPMTASIVHTELTNGDKEYPIHVFGQTAGGEWNG